MIEGMIYGILLLAAFVLGYYLAGRQYQGHIAKLEDWVLRLVNDYGKVTDSALHMKKAGYEPDPQYEAARDAPPLPELTGELGAMIDHIENSEYRDRIRTEALEAIAAGEPEEAVLQRLVVGADPLWALRM